MKNVIDRYNSKYNNYSSSKKPNLFILTEPDFTQKKTISKTMKNINKISLKTKKVRRYSISIRNEFIKKMEKKPKLNEKQIYAPLYAQIRKSLREIEKEKKIANNYILPEKEIIKRVKIPMYNTIFKLVQRNALLLGNEEKSLSNYYFKDDKSKNKKKNNNNSKNNSKNNIFLKTFSGNFFNHKIYIRNKGKNKTSKNINRFNFELSSKTNFNLLTPTSTGSIIKKKSSLLDSKDGINKLNISTIKTPTNTNAQSIKNNNEDKNELKARYKTYFIEYDPYWYHKNKLIKNRIDKNMITSPLFQKKIIDDELALIFEYMKIFQSQYLIDKNLGNYFNKISWYTQRSLNYHLEQSIGLLTEISYLLLNGYDNIIQNFITNPIQRITNKKIKYVYDEKKEFTLNISTFSETYIFLQVCYDAYCIIYSNKEEYSISKSNFEILNQYLDRARFVVSKVCMDLKNMYKEQNKEDKKIIEDCLKKIKNVNRKALFNNLKIINKNIGNNQNIKKKKKLKSKIDCHLKFGVFKSGIDSFRYKGPKELKLSEEHLTNLRINKAFGANSYRDLKPHSHFAKFDINSSLINQLMKYATNDFKTRVISERIRQRFIKTDLE